MAGLYGRVAARGYGEGVPAGMTGEEALLAQQAYRRPAQSFIDFGTPTSTLTGFDPEGPPPPGYDIQDDGEMWGLPGSADDPYTSPGYGPGNVRTHAAPMPGWAGSYHPITEEGKRELEVLHENSAGIHGADFGMPERNITVYDVPEIPVDHWTANGPDLGAGTGQAPLTGPQRVLGGADAVQGYDLRNRYGFDAGHKDRTTTPGPANRDDGQPLIYIDPAERPFIVPQAQGSFIPTDAVQGPGPWVSDLHGENLSYDDPSAYAAPPEPSTLQQPLAAAPADGGWFG